MHCAAGWASSRDRLDELLSREGQRERPLEALGRFIAGRIALAPR
jgi:hypothetical protein